MKLKQIIVLAIGLLVFGGALYYANHERFSLEEGASFVEFETARVIDILEDNTFIDPNFPDITQGNQLLQLEILTGRYEGKIVETMHHFATLATVHHQAGERVSLRIDTFNYDEIFSTAIHSPERREVVFGLVIAFLLVLSLIGGKQGVKSVISLLFTLVSIIFLLIPLMLKGHSAIGTTILILALVTVICLVLISGVTTKTVSAILGCLVGSVAAAVIAGIAGRLTTISGYNMEDIGNLMAAQTDVQISGLFISGVLIASLGAVMDTAVSIASAMEEIKVANSEITFSQLFKSGMNVGRDTMGTMSNTLILAFVGAALNMVMIMYALETPFNQIINNDFIAIELIRGIAGSFGIILTVPAVSFIGAKLLTKSEKKMV